MLILRIKLQKHIKISKKHGEYKMNLTKEQVKELEFEELPKYAKIDLTRLVRSTIDDNYFLGLRFVNMKETVLGKRITEPVFDEFGESLSSSLTMFVISSVENIFNGLETSEIVELLFDYIQSNLIQTNYINNIFKEYEIPILFQTDRQDHLRIEVESLKENSVSEQEHSNIKKLISRMDRDFANDDYTGVLHSSASIYETLVKDISRDPKIQNMSLGQILNNPIFSQNIPDQILDYIQEIFKKRNIVHTAGHGGTSKPTITKEETIIIQEFTKTIVRVLRKVI